MSTAAITRPSKTAIGASLDMQMPSNQDLDDIAKASPSSENNSQNAHNSHPGQIVVSVLRSETPRD